MSFEDFARQTNAFTPSQTLTRAIAADRDFQLSAAGAAVGTPVTLGTTWGLIKSSRQKAAPPPPPPSFASQLGTAIRENPGTAIGTVAVVAGSAYVATRMAKRNNNSR
ncbi:hypothetical protein CONLIGDRAFT_502195 [Coniochaeta ligniaria NRRL 30616]|uniref:Uncharacterized protein n=1 Tax=Coniochaeta ligniaria NRRL 30616 TaxID=1408157 RepID=A0A1J7IDS9_9PEZI|nr:hypothetical protein CONLIGDRAFT_502195 [Coniochaeta ligniaria NRRL 30616]